MNIVNLSYECEYNINNILDKNDYINMASSISLDDAILIAMQVKPFYSRIKKAEFIDEISKEIINSTNFNNVYITFDTDLYYMVYSCNNSIESKKKVFDIALRRQR